MSPEPNQSPEPPSNPTDPAFAPDADQLPATRENWPGRSEPGHIHRIGPSRRIGDHAGEPKKPDPSQP